MIAKLGIAAEPGRQKIVEALVRPRFAGRPVLFEGRRPARRRGRVVRSEMAGEALSAWGLRPE